MNITAGKINNVAVETAEKQEIKEMAEMLSNFQRLPAEKRIALRYYIKGTLNGMQMEEEREARPVARAAI